MQPRDIVLSNKISIIRRAVKRAREEFVASKHFDTDFTHQDAAVLNLERACQASISIANRVISELDLPLPNSIRESFAILTREQLIPIELGKSLEAMVGFRNIAVHAYQELDLEIVKFIILERSKDLLAFADLMFDLDMQRQKPLGES
jgi:uncharacterized protein YutE (UPF0331/DUF86 family)